MWIRTRVKSDHISPDTSAEQEQLILLAADRVDVAESPMRSLASAPARPNPITETGILSELDRHGIDSRIGMDCS
jgi:hypothetical protein